ncbi:MAG: type II secretion system F family protein [Treponema sp.]|nr:type II secretion system F family protein [Treponema sp.]
MSATLQFTEILLALIKGNTGLIDALYILSQDGIEKQVRDCAKALLLLMKKGHGFSDSLHIIQNMKVHFNSMYITLIAAAELTGAIDKALEQIASDLQRKKMALEKAYNILIYPAIIIFIAASGTLMLIFKGMPLFIAGGILLEETITETVFGIITAGIVLLSGGIALFTAYFRIFYYDSYGFRIFYMMDFLLKNNITMIDALDQCIANIKNRKYSLNLKAIKREIVNGIPFSDAFGKLMKLPPYIKTWLSVADINGNAGEVCLNIKNYYEREDSKKREVFTRLIEPSVIILTGSYLLILILTVIIPILTLTGGLI